MHWGLCALFLPNGVWKLCRSTAPGVIVDLIAILKCTQGTLSAPCTGDVNSMSAPRLHQPQLILQIYSCPWGQTRSVLPNSHIRARLMKCLPNSSATASTSILSGFQCECVAGITSPLGRLMFHQTATVRGMNCIRTQPGNCITER